MAFTCFLFIILYKIQEKSSAIRTPIEEYHKCQNISGYTDPDATASTATGPSPKVGKNAPHDLYPTTVLALLDHPTPVISLDKVSMSVRLDTYGCPINTGAFLTTAMELGASHLKEGMNSLAEVEGSTRRIVFKGISFWFRTRHPPNLSGN